MTVYVDVLVILNLYINYFLIRSAALLMRRELSAKRCLLAAGIGAAGSLLALLPELPFWANAAIKCGICAIMSFAAFGRQKKSDFAVSLLCLMTISFVFAGTMLALWSFCAPFGMIYSNGAAYFDIPLSAIAVLTAVAYAIVRAVRYFADKRRKCSRILAVEISRGGRTAALNGLCDTGNSLRDVFSGKPVIVCGRESISAIVPENVSGYLDGNLPEGVRLIPCRTVADNALIPVFAADSVKVDGRRADAVIGVTDSSLGESVDCIFSPDIISM